MKKKLALLIVIAAVIAGVIAYFQVPRPVVKAPENTTISVIAIGPSNRYYKSDENPYMEWRPETEEEQETAAKIVAYLSQTTEKRSGYKTIDHLIGASRCIEILLVDDYGERIVLIGPNEEYSPLWAHTVNISLAGTIYGNDYAWPDFLRQFQGKLQDPDGIRAFVLNALGLPEDYV